MLRQIRFLLNSPPYNSGEVAGFDEAKAEQYIKAGIATPFHPAAAAGSTGDTPARQKRAGVLQAMSIEEIQDVAKEHELTLGDPSDKAENIERILAHEFGPGAKAAKRRAKLEGLAAADVKEIAEKHKLPVSTKAENIERILAHEFPANPGE